MLTISVTITSPDTGQLFNAGFVFGGDVTKGNCVSVIMRVVNTTNKQSLTKMKGSLGPCQLC